MKKQSSKRRVITSMLKRIFREPSNVFTVSAGKANKFIKIFSLQTDGPEHKRKKSNNSFSAC